MAEHGSSASICRFPFRHVCGPGMRKTKPNSSGHDNLMHMCCWMMVWGLFPSLDPPFEIVGPAKAIPIDSCAQLFWAVTSSHQASGCRRRQLSAYDSLMRDHAPTSRHYSDYYEFRIHGQHSLALQRGFTSSKRRCCRWVPSSRDVLTTKGRRDGYIIAMFPASLRSAAGTFIGVLHASCKQRKPIIPVQVNLTSALPSPAHARTRHLRIPLQNPACPHNASHSAQPWRSLDASSSVQRGHMGDTLARLEVGAWTSEPHGGGRGRRPTDDYTKVPGYGSPRSRR
jgi:hypothetical protein